MDPTINVSEVTNDLSGIAASIANPSLEGTTTTRKGPGRPKKSVIPQPPHLDEKTTSVLQKVVEKFPGAPPPPTPPSSPRTRRQTASVQEAPEMAKKIQEYERIRIGLIQKVNRYLSDPVIVHALGDVKMKPLGIDSPLQTAETTYKSIVKMLNSSGSIKTHLQKGAIYCNSAAFKMMFDVHNPELDKHLHEVFLAETDQEFSELAAELGGMFESNLYVRLGIKWAQFLYTAHEEHKRLKFQGINNAEVDENLINLGL